MADISSSETPQETQPTSTPPLNEAVAVSSLVTDPDIVKNQEIAGLSYMPFVCLFIFFFRKDSAFVQKNAKQGVSLFVLVIVGWILTAIPLINIIGYLILIFSLTFIVLGFLRAFSDGKIVSIPLISNYLRNMDVEGVKSDVKQEVSKIMNTPVINEENIEQKGVEESGDQNTK